MDKTTALKESGIFVVIFREKRKAVLADACRNMVRDC
jgi:hypothetical protein